MGFLDKVLGRGGNKKNANVALTQLGVQKAEQSFGQGIKLTILSDLAENGASSYHAIAERTGIDEARVRDTVKRFEADGWAKKVTPEA